MSANPRNIARLEIESYAPRRQLTAKWHSPPYWSVFAHCVVTSSWRGRAGKVGGTFGLLCKLFGNGAGNHPPDPDNRQCPWRLRLVSAVQSSSIQQDLLMFRSCQMVWHPEDVSVFLSFLSFFEFFLSFLSFFEFFWVFFKFFWFFWVFFGIFLNFFCVFFCVFFVFFVFFLSFFVFF